MTTHPTPRTRGQRVAAALLAILTAGTVALAVEIHTAPPAEATTVRVYGTSYSVIRDRCIYIHNGKLVGLTVKRDQFGQLYMPCDIP